MVSCAPVPTRQDDVNPERDKPGDVVLCFGASGAVGRFIVARLVAAGRQVVAVTRATPPADAPGVRWIRGDLSDATAVPAGVTAIASAGPLDHFVAWLECADLAGVARVVALGSMSAASKRESADPAERELAGRLAASEARLAQRCDALGIAWTILRPTLIYGAAADRNLSRIAHFARRSRLFPWIPRARGLRQPVHCDDVAAGCVAALASPAAAGCRFELGGGERLTYADMLRRTRTSLGFRTLPVPLSVSVMKLATRILGRGGAMVQRLNVDLVADNAPAEAAFGYRPRPFRPTRDCWFATSDPPGTEGRV